MSKWQTDNQPDYEDRLPRGKGKRTLMLEAIEEQFGSKEAFFQKVLAMGFGSDGNPPIPMLIAEAVKRIEPALKPSGEKVKIDLPENSTHEQKAAKVIESVADGTIAPEVGQALIGMIKDTIAIAESTDLIKRLEAMEQALKAK